MRHMAPGLSPNIKGAWWIKVPAHTQRLSDPGREFGLSVKIFREVRSALGVMVRFRVWLPNAECRDATQDFPIENCMDYNEWRFILCRRSDRLASEIANIHSSRSTRECKRFADEDAMPKSYTPRKLVSECTSWLPYEMSNKSHYQDDKVVNAMSRGHAFSFLQG